MRYYIYNKIRHRINDYRSKEKLITQAIYGFTREGGLDGLLAESVTVKEVEEEGAWEFIYWSHGLMGITAAALGRICQGRRRIYE